MGWPLWAPAAKDWGSAWPRIRLRRAPHEDLPVRATAVVPAVADLAEARVRTLEPAAGESAAVEVVEAELVAEVEVAGAEASRS